MERISTLLLHSELELIWKKDSEVPKPRITSAWKLIPYRFKITLQSLHLYLLYKVKGDLMYRVLILVNFEFFALEPDFSFKLVLTHCVCFASKDRFTYVETNLVERA